MKAVSRPFSGKNYWRKNGYTLLNGAASTKRSIQVVKITGRGGDGEEVKRKRVWRLRRAPKVVVMAVMRPKKLWARLRDGYMKMMMKMAGGVGSLTGGGESGFLGKRITAPTKSKVPSKQQVEDFESRLVLEIYKAMATSRGLSEVY